MPSVHRERRLRTHERRLCTRERRLYTHEHPLCTGEREMCNCAIECATEVAATDGGQFDDRRTGSGTCCAVSALCWAVSALGGCILETAGLR